MEIDPDAKKCVSEFCNLFGDSRQPGLNKDLENIALALYRWYFDSNFDFCPGELCLNRLRRYGGLGERVLDYLKNEFHSGYIRQEIDRYEKETLNRPVLA